LFAPTSFWRDLIAFTWNITTVENRDGVEDLQRTTMESTDARSPRRPTASSRRGSGSRPPSGAAPVCCG
jgi:hypothetical protein